MNKTAYSTGDRVVLQPYGIGVVCGIQTRSVSSASTAYYQVEFPGSHSKAYVPVDAPTATGMRPALCCRDLPELRFRLDEKGLNLPRQWAARHRRVGEILASGNPFDIATLLGEFRAWHLERGLADLDHQAYRRALKLMLQEVRALEGENVAEVREWLEGAWREACN